MSRKEKKTTKSLIIVFIITYLVLAAFAGAFVFFAFIAPNQNINDDVLNGGIVSLALYHLNQVLPLLRFSYKGDGFTGVVNYILSGLFYFFVFIAVLYLVVGIAVGAKKKRGIVVPAIIASFLTPVVYLVVATGADKFLPIVLGKDPYGFKVLLMIPVILLALFGLVYIVLSYIGYFGSLATALKKPAVVQEEAVQEEVSQEQPVAEEVPNSDEITYIEEPVAFEEITDEDGMMYEPLPEPAPEEQPKEQPQPKEQQPQPEEKTNDRDDLKSMLREVVRDIVRDEIARNNANQSRNDFNPLGGGTITGATFGGPLVVQYFNGGINSPNPQPAPAPQPAPQSEPAAEKPQPAPVEEEAVPEIQPEEVVEPAPVVEEPKPEPVPVVVAPAPAAEEKKPIIRIPFTERMINADDEMKNNYNELKNEILSYGVNSRVSNSGDTFRLHRKTYVKITIAGLSLKLYFALDPEEYKDSTLPVQNAGHKGIYNEIPLVFKVKSGLSMRRCKQLIQDVFDKNGLEQGEIRNINWVEELKNVPQDDSDEED